MLFSVPAIWYNVMFLCGAFILWSWKLHSASSILIDSCNEYFLKRLILFTLVLSFNRQPCVQVMRIWRIARRCEKWHGVDQDGTNVSHVLVSGHHSNCAWFLSGNVFMCSAHVSAQPLPPAVLALQPPQFETHYPLASAVLPLRTLSVASLKLTASSRPTALPNGSAKCLRVGHWLTLCTLNVHILTYLL